METADASVAGARIRLRAGRRRAHRGRAAARSEAPSTNARPTKRARVATPHAAPALKTHGAVFPVPRNLSLPPGDIAYPKPLHPGDDDFLPPPGRCPAGTTV